MRGEDRPGPSPVLAETGVRSIAHCVVVVAGAWWQCLLLSAAGVGRLLSCGRQP